MDRKRFIAGARCPKCQMEDRIVVYQKQGLDWLECVACGFKQNEDDAKKPKPKEITIKWPIKRKDNKD